MTDHDPLSDLRAALAELTDAQLRQAIIQSDTPERRDALGRRLAPYRTPVTEATMRRGAGPMLDDRQPETHTLTGGRRWPHHWVLTDDAHERVCQQLLLTSDGRSVLRDAARMLAELRDDGTSWSPSGRRDINEMIDRCNLASMGIDGSASRVEPGLSDPVAERCRGLLADACAGTVDSESAADAWDLARYCEHIRDEQIAIIGALERIFGDNAEHLGQPYGDSFAAVQDALGRLRVVADEDAPDAVLRQYEWHDLRDGSWYHSSDDTVAAVREGSVCVKGEREMEPSELRALAELADGKVAPANTGPRDVLAAHGWSEVAPGKWIHDEGSASAAGNTFEFTDYPLGPDELMAFAALAKGAP